jgi:hypothetical protein
MIASIHFCKSARAAFEYDSKRKDASHVILVDSSFGKACPKDEIIRNLELVAMQNDDPRIVKKFAHISLSFSPHEQLMTYQKLAGITKHYLNEMGYIGCPYVLHLHKDRPHPHVHAIVTRVNMEGTVVNTKHDRYRSMETCRQIEKNLELVPVASKPAGVRMDHREKHAYIYGYNLNLFEIRKKINECRKKSYSWHEFVETANQAGVHVQVRGNRQGVTYKIQVDDESGDPSDFIVSGRRLGRNYMLQQLDPYFKEREDNQIGWKIESVIASKPATTADFHKRLAEHGITIDASKYWNLSISKMPEGIHLKEDQIPKKLGEQIRWEVSRLQYEEERRKKEDLQRLIEKVSKAIWLDRPTNEDTLASKLANRAIAMKRDGKDVVFQSESSGAEVKASDMDPNLKRVLYCMLETPHLLWQLDELRLREKELLEERERKKKKREKWEEYYRYHIDPCVTDTKLNALWRKMEEDEVWAEYEKRKEEERIRKANDPWAGGFLPAEVLEERRRAEIRRGWEDIPDSLRNRDPNEERNRGRERGLSPGSGW